MGTRDIETIDAAIQKANRVRREIEAAAVPSPEDIARLEGELAAAQEAYDAARRAVYHAGEVGRPGGGARILHPPFPDQPPAAHIPANLSAWPDAPPEAALRQFAGEVAGLRRQFAARREDEAAAGDRLRAARHALHDARRAVTDRETKLEQGRTILRQLGAERQAALDRRALRSVPAPGLAERAARLRRAGGVALAPGEDPTGPGFLERVKASILGGVSDD